MSDLPPTKSQSPKATGGLRRNPSRFGNIDPIDAILRISARATKPEQFMHQFIIELSKSLDCLLVSFYRFEEPDTLTLVEIETNLPQKDSYLKTNVTTKSEEPIAQVARLQQSQVFPNIEEEENKYLQGVLHPDAISTFTAPLIVNNKLYGVIDIQTSEGNKLTRTDGHYLNTVIKLTGAYLDNLINKEKITLPAEDLMRFFSATTQMFSAESEAKLDEALHESFFNSEFVMGLFFEEKKNLVLKSLYDPFGTSFDQSLIGLSVNYGELFDKIQNRDVLIVSDLPAQTEFGDLFSFFIRRECQSLAIIPIRIKSHITKILIIATRSPSAINKDQIKTYFEIKSVYEERLSFMQLQEITQIQDSLQEFSADVSNKIVKSNNLEFLFDTFIKEFRSFCGDEIDLIYAKSDPNNENIVYEYCLHAGKNVKLPPSLMGDDLPSHILNNNRPLLINSGTDPDLDLYPYPFPDTQKPNSIISVPIVGNDSSQRLMMLASMGDKIFNDKELIVINIVGLMISQQITQFEKETSYESLSKEAESNLNLQRKLSEISKKLSEYKTHNEVLAALPRLLSMADLAKRIATFEPYGEGELRMISSVGLAETRSEIISIDDENIVPETAKTLSPILVKDYQNEKKKPISPDSLSGITLPLTYENKLYGILNLEDNNPSRFSITDFELFQILASNIGSLFSSFDLIAQIQQQVDRQQQLYEAAERIRRSLDMESIIKISTEEIAKLTQAKQAKIEIHFEEDLESRSIDKGESE